MLPQLIRTMSTTINNINYLLETIAASIDNKILFTLSVVSIKTFKVLHIQNIIKERSDLVSHFK